MLANSGENKNDFELDLSYLSTVSNGSTEFMIDIISLFLTQIPEYFEKLDQYIENKNWAAVAEIAHKIKPSLTFMGVKSTMADMGEIEKNARDLENLDSIPVLFIPLKSMSGELFQKLALIKSELESTL